MMKEIYDIILNDIDERLLYRDSKALQEINNKLHSVICKSDLDSEKLREELYNKVEEDLAYFCGNGNSILTSTRDKAVIRIILDYLKTL